jgi:geranylgeranyl diphosphate synthase type I
MVSCREEKRASVKEEASRNLVGLFEQRGRRALEMTQQYILEEETDSDEVKSAFNYFATKYWRDLARPTLLSLSCEAVGGNPNDTNPIAVSLSLISGGLDIHDDLIDLSKVKNGRTTVFGGFGKDIALLVGDALIFKGLTLLSQLSSVSRKKTSAISEVLKCMFFELGDGEALELKFRKRLDVLPSEYLDVLGKKAADVEAHTRIAAIVGNATDEEMEILGSYGRKLGKLIIVGDDIADAVDPEELLHRIEFEHLPLPVVVALKDQELKPRITSILKRQNLGKFDAQEIFEAAFDGGAFSAVEELMTNLAEEALAELRKLRYCRTELGLLVNSTLTKKRITHKNLKRSP